MKKMARACLSLTALVLMPATGMACLPEPGWTPPTVEQLYRSATYVVYAEGVAPVSTARGERITVKVLEHFKGPRLDSIAASGASCERAPGIGMMQVHFLDQDGRGQTMAYPFGQSVDHILTALRRIKAQDATGAAPSSLPDK